MPLRACLQALGRRVKQRRGADRNRTQQLVGSITELELAAAARLQALAVSAHPQEENS